MQCHPISERARLRPVLEVSPGDLGRADADERAFDEESSGVYWRQCLAQAGLLDVHPVVDDAWLIYADEMTASLSVRNLVTAHLAPLLQEGRLSARHAPPLSGGFVLLDGDTVMLRPGCCGDLGDLREWEAAAAHRSRSPTPLWTGHPYLWVWFEDGRLYLREDQEDGYPDQPKTVSILPTTLAEALFHARKEVETLFGRVAGVLEGVSEVDDPAEMAHALVGRLSGRDRRDRGSHGNAA